MYIGRIRLLDPYKRPDVSVRLVFEKMGNRLFVACFLAAKRRK